MSVKSNGERLLAQLISEAPDIPAPERGKRFSATRRWTVDFLWRSDKVFVEIDGGNHMIRRNRYGNPVVVGRHTRDADYWKLNQATLEGYKFLRFTPQMLQRNPDRCMEQIRQLVGLPLDDIRADNARFVETSARIARAAIATAKVLAR